jgi:hypothetical protein
MSLRLSIILANDDHKPRCNAFLDPLIEHPPLILLLDLVLLKPRVFLHLLFNRGSTPLSAVEPNDDQGKRQEAREVVLRDDLIRLVSVTVFAETAIRLIPQSSGLDQDTGIIWPVLGMVMAELIVQYLTTLGLSLAVLRWRGWYPFRADDRNTMNEQRDGRQEYFMYVCSSSFMVHILIEWRGTGHR